MKTKKILLRGFAVFFILIVFFMLVLSFGLEPTSLNLTKGKNYLSLNITEPFYVETLIKLNPNIQVVSYKEGNKTVGYVNIFEGIGKNFIVEDGEYEIIVKENITLLLPY